MENERKGLPPIDAQALGPLKINAPTAGELMAQRALEAASSESQVDDKNIVTEPYVSTTTTRPVTTTIRPPVTTTTPNNLGPKPPGIQPPGEIGTTIPSDPEHDPTTAVNPGEITPSTEQQTPPTN